MSDSIPFLVDQVEQPVHRGMRSGAGARALDVVIDVAADALKERVSRLVRLVSEAAEAAPADGAFQTAEVRFTLHVGGNGEISLLSLAKGGFAAGAGIEFTLRKRPES